ncbi:carbohydrate ABC transporter substrate-binding protein (CUT1 family) [Hoeflea halophila]|uniref:Probable sugar-binding periplasmic protein n=1 Tax=Hoeflea halophila TaxID=714899 RepID=A0A286IAF6_9HYPH|nr:ABC transporter substrate-binding protein [Hoeflea halophila]SOE17070.1 carbohydrate ABC transporter substrate-binding protein (CUT1 family) [Hoeflea halophila]
MNTFKLFLAGASVLALSTSVNATDLEVTHWWTSGGEAAAVAEFAKAFDATGHKWVDGAIAGGGGTARPIVVSRIIGGDPMGAFQFNHGRQAEELIEAGLLRDMTDVAEREGWKDIVNPPSLLDACTIDGRIYCAPVNIHSWQWVWLSHAAFEKAGVAVPTSWDEFAAAGKALRDAGIQPLALGGQPWQSSGLFNVLMATLAGPDVLTKIYGEKDADLAAGPEMAKVFQAASDARSMAEGSNVQDWNQATNLVITGKAGGQIMGDWAQGEFAVAGQTAGTDYTCLPGLGMREIISTGGDAFYFPVIDNAEITAAQDVLAATLLKPETQVAFNLKKGSLPIRGDIDLSAANDCMKEGLGILAKGNTMPDVNMLNTEDTNNQLNDLFVQFFQDASITPEAAQERFVEIVRNKD